MIWWVIGLALGLVLGVVAETTGGWCVPGAAALVPATAGVVVALYLVRRERRWLPTPRAVIVIAASLIAVPLGMWRTAPWVAPPVPGSLRHALSELEDGTPVKLWGHICAEPEWRTPRRCDLHVRVNRIWDAERYTWREVTPGVVAARVLLTSHSGPGAERLFATLTHPDAYGYTVTIHAPHAPPAPPLNPGTFDRPRFLRQLGLVAEYRCQVSRIRLVAETRGFLLTEVALDAKQRFLATYRATIRSPASRLVAAATLGARRAVDGVTYAGQDMVDMFRHAGVGHVLAVSGLHVSVVSLLLFTLFVTAGIRPRVFTPLLVLSLALFGLLTGARPSNVRAVIMNAAVLTAYAYTRCNLRAATFVGLSLSASVIILARPLVLFAPSFLLSYGAVLSLVLIAPVLHRWLCLLRGGALILAACWSGVLLVLLAVHPQIWLRASTLLAAGAWLWLAIFLGGRWNERRPSLWRIGFERLPLPLRLFVSAQLAIQIGMMIPLSAWFFGRFPAAGIVVNMVAIPAIGILVPLGILVGLLGLLPGIGVLPAMPVGALATVVGEFFFGLAYIGTRLFPFVAVPTPTLPWMSAYYGVLGAVLSVPLWGGRVRALLMRLRPHVGAVHGWRYLPYGLALMGILSPLVAHVPRSERTATVTCVATDDYPVLTVVSTQHRAVLLNAGDRATGMYKLFDVLRGQGADAVELAVLNSPHPDAGNRGLAALMGKLRVHRCVLPFVSTSTSDYLATVGDAYLQDKAAEGVGWAVAYREGYAALRDAAARRGASVSIWPPHGIRPWNDLELAALPRPAEVPNRFASRAMSRVVRLRVAGFEWVIVTESTAAALRAAAEGYAHARCDVLVLPAPGYRRAYRDLVRAALDGFKPKVVIASGDQRRMVAELVTGAAGGDDDEGNDDPVLFVTGVDGAVTATFQRDGKMQLKAIGSGRRGMGFQPVSPDPEPQALSGGATGRMPVPRGAGLIAQLLLI